MKHHDPLGTPLPLESYKQETEGVSRAEAAELKILPGVVKVLLVHSWVFTTPRLLHCNP